MSQFFLKESKDVKWKLLLKDSSPKNENVMFICLPPGHPSCSCDCVSSVEHKIWFLTQTEAVCNIMTVNGTHGFESKKKTKKHTQLTNIWYIEVLRHKIIGLCKKMNSISRICCTWACWHVTRRLLWTQCGCFFYSQSRGSHWLLLYDWQTATVWVKNLRLCSTEETKSPTSWMPWGKQITSHFHFGWTIPLSLLFLLDVLKMKPLLTWYSILKMWCLQYEMLKNSDMNCNSQRFSVYHVLGKVTFKSNALQFCVTPEKSY